MYKVLILCPIFEGKGGVSNYYTLFNQYFKSKDFKVEYYFTGKKLETSGFASRIQYSLKDLFYLFQNFCKYDLIHLNPSLDPKALIRDGVYHFVAKRIFRKKTMVFFRGWDTSLAKRLEYRFSWLFKLVYNFDLGLVLANDFKASFLKMGYSGTRITLETTSYEGERILNRGKGRNKRKNIIFLARLVKVKGCLEAIKTIEILRKKYLDIKLNMAGDGEYLDFLKEYVKKNGLDSNVNFTGYLTGNEKYEMLADSSIMLFPTYEAEGMPNSILEGMAAGLAIVARPVGGIPDIFEDGKNGFLVNSLDPEDFVKAIEKIWGTPSLWESISEYNMKYAEERFEIRRVVKRIEKIYLDVIGSK